MMSVILPAGSIIYRARNIKDPSHALNPNKCGDTGKTGLYFSDYQLICLGMAVEYGVDIDLYTYRVEQPIVLYEGKYSFREINPDRYFKDGNFIPYVEAIETENISHFDVDGVPIYDNVEEAHRNAPENALGEIFINQNDLHCLSLVSTEIICLEHIKQTIL